MVQPRPDKNIHYQGQCEIKNPVFVYVKTKRNKKTVTTRRVSLVTTTTDSPTLNEGTRWTIEIRGRRHPSVNLR